MSVRISDLFAGSGFAIAGAHQPINEIVNGIKPVPAEDVPIYAQEWFCGLSGSEVSFFLLLLTAGAVLLLRFFEIKTERLNARIKQIELDKLENPSD